MSGERGIIGELQCRSLNRHAALSIDRDDAAFPRINRSRRVDSIGQLHISWISVPDFNHLRRRRLIDRDQILFRRCISGNNTILDILSHAAITISGHQHLKTIFVVGGSHLQRLIHVSLIGRGIEHSYVFRDHSGDVRDELNASSRGDSLVSRQHSFDHCASRHIGSSQCQRSQQTDRFWTKHCIQTGQQCDHKQRGAEADQYSSIDGFINMNFGQLDGRSLLQGLLYRRIILTTTGLKID